MNIGCYCVIHVGCKNRLGVLASQAFHAGRESVCVLPVDNTESVWTLQAQNSDELEALVATLTVKGVRHIAIREPDAPWNGTLVAVASDCYEKEIIAPYFAMFERLK